jgi:hypothetical protein
MSCSGRGRRKRRSLAAELSVRQTWRVPVRIVAIAVAILAASAACVSTHMKKYLGKDVRYIAVDDGAPVNVFDMPDGRRAFQYFWGGGTYVVPKTTTTQGQVQLVGDAAYYSEQKLESGGFMVQS